MSDAAHMMTVAAEKGLSSEGMWGRAQEKVHAHVAGTLIIPGGGRYANGTWERIAEKHAPDGFVYLLTERIMERFRMVVKVRMEMPQLDYCGIVWKEEYLLEALLLLSQKNCLTRFVVIRHN